jgi:hypothetical protein
MRIQGNSMNRQGEGQKRGPETSSGYGPWVRSVGRTVSALRHRRATLAARSLPPLQPLPMNLLRRIEHASFPLTIHDGADIRCASVLAAASLVEANLPKPDVAAGRSGVIMRITAAGREQLERLRDAHDPTAGPELSAGD